jgi:long-subunit acyl-CoA synthetase (AMP-forming)
MMRARVSLTTTTTSTGYSSGTTGLSKGVELTHQNMTVVLRQFAGAVPAVNSGKDSSVAFL